ncbi:MAG: hypothetical protein PF541_17965, partial [Prolixibacteraceae bacterium]|nr:hypothetical protein [Prolixibacteraceae bacterium]
MISFPSKILLFGEYGLVLGGSGFAIPNPMYSGELKFQYSLQSTQSIQSSQSVQQFYAFLIKNKDQFHFLNLLSFGKDVKNGLWFDSSIPKAYGLGSSGALIAAIYSKYKFDENNNIVLVKKQLAAMESYFHGTSSGIDPCVSYFNKPISIVSKNEIQIHENWRIETLGLTVFMVDTEIKSETTGLVDWFLSQMNDLSFKQQINETFLSKNKKIVASINKNKSIEMDDLLIVSKFQYDNLEPMIPEGFKMHFKQGLDNKLFAFK